MHPPSDFFERLQVWQEISSGNEFHSLIGRGKQSTCDLSIHFGHTRTDFISLSNSRLLAMTDARPCLERSVSLSSLSTMLFNDFRPGWSSITPTLAARL